MASIPNAERSGHGTVEEASTVAAYLASRLFELGIEHIFNVPGSYCGGLMRALRKSSFVHPVFTTYELEAVHAADAYARVKGFGAFCGTYGVGALSSLSGVAGAFVERCPIIAINGGPSNRQLQEEIEHGVLFLHSTGRLRTDYVIYRHVTVAAEIVQTAADAPNQIDAALTACMSRRRPVYLEISQDLWDQPCPPPGAPLKVVPQESNPGSLSECLDEVVSRLRQSARPIIWGGEELDRWDLQDRFCSLVRQSGINYVTTLPGKAILSETTPGFVGVYDGRFARRETQAIVSRADLVIAIGTAISAFIGDIVAKDYGSMVLAAGDGVRVGFHTYTTISLGDFISGLTARLSQDSYTPPVTSAGTIIPRSPEETMTAHEQGSGSGASAPPERERDATTVTFDLFFSRIEKFIEDKIAIADTSLALFASADLKIQSRSSFVSQAIWMSIGYSLGASVGAAFASPKRPVIFVGDAGFREGPQVLSTLVQCNLPAVLCIMSNALLGIQQFLSGPGFYADNEAPDYFNVIHRWDYAALAMAFGAKFSQVTTLAELESALQRAEEEASKPYLIEVVLDPKDLPYSVADALPRLAPSQVQSDFEFPLLSRQNRVDLGYGSSGADVDCVMQTEPEAPDG
jgi:indolepyruvate decarboxylase